MGAVGLFSADRAVTSSVTPVGNEQTDNMAGVEDGQKLPPPAAAAVTATAIN